MKAILMLIVFFVATSEARAKCDGHTKPVQGCMFTLKDLEREQSKLNQVDDSFNLKSSLKNLFSGVNGKLLAFDHLVMGRYTLKIDMTSTKVNVTLNGRPARDTEMCFKVCPGKKSITWFNDERGEFRKIANGLSVGGYKFLIEEN